MNAQAEQVSSETATVVQTIVDTKPLETAISGSVPAVSTNKETAPLPAGIVNASDSIKGLVNEEAATKWYKILESEANRSTGLTERLFWLIRQCGQATAEDGTMEWLPYERALAVAEGTIRAAETQFCRARKIKNVNQFVNDFGVKVCASYLAIKSTIMGAIHDREELITHQQLLWTFEHEKEGKEAKFTHQDLLNIWTNHYNDNEKQKGSTRFMADFRKCQQSGKELESKVRLAARAAETALKEAAAKSQQTSTPAISGPNAGIATSGSGEKSTQLPEPVLKAMNLFVNSVHAAVGHLTDAELSAYLMSCSDALRTETERKIQIVKDKASESGKRPIIQAETEKLPEVKELIKPDYVTEDDWNVDDSYEARLWFIENKEEYLEAKAIDEQNIRDFAPDEEKHGPENIHTDSSGELTLDPFKETQSQPDQAVG